MFESLYSLICDWSAANVPLAALASFAWGLCSVLFSPCHLAAIPVMAVHAAGFTRLAPAQAQHTHDPHTPESTADTAQAAVEVGASVSVCFALGYFLAIAALGIACSLLGRVLDFEGLGEHFWFVPAGLVLLWFALGLWREHDCSRSGQALRGLARWLRGRALSGSVLLGAGYGVLSLGCTLAFLAPVLIIALPQGVVTSCVLAVAFALGHCLPMALVGLMTKLARRLLRVCSTHGHTHEVACTHSHHSLEQRFRRLAAVVIALAAVVLLLHPFLEH